jgi:hypothetical protein
MVTRVTKLVVYDVRTGDGSGPYDKGAYYVEWDELVKQLREALDAGRSILLDKEEMTEAEYAALGDEFPEGTNPLL